ncbi:MAG: hypothetical protein M1836_006410 [Candelina mexicana]|nr:MAG: hypothetical protein M1836_006410 [Candelina mexicana]
MEAEIEQLTLDQLQQGAIPVWDPEFGKKLSSALNPLLRTYFNRYIAEPIHFPIDTPGPNIIDHNDRHADHFLEIQHVIQAIISEPGGNPSDVCDRPVGEWLRLSRFLNHKYNLYSIPAAYNLFKSHIDFELYRPGTGPVPPGQADQRAFMQAYLRAEVDGDDLADVGGRIMVVLRAMQNATGMYRELCNVAGGILQIRLFEALPSLRERLEAGEFDQR